MGDRGDVASAPPLLTQLPNALTIARFVLIPVFVVLLASADDGHSWAAGIIFGVAGITDQIDGWLARRWHVESEFGKYADPLADRLMIDAAIIMLFIADRLPWAALAIILARDALLVAGTRFVLPRGYDFSVSFLGKAATWVLYAAIGFLLVTHDEREWPLWVFCIGLGMAVAAGVLYVLGLARDPGAAGGDEDEGRRHGRGRGHAAAPADLEPAEADGPDRRQAVHGAHPRAAAHHGFDDVIVTLAFLPQAIRSYFGDGDALGLTIEYSVEESPLGTAGSVRLASGSSTTPSSSSRATPSATSTSGSCSRSTARRARR